MIHKNWLFVNAVLNAEYIQEQLHIQNSCLEPEHSIGRLDNYHENGNLHHDYEKDQQIGLKSYKAREKIKEMKLEGGYVYF